VTTASADFAPCFKLKKKKKPLPAMFQGQRLTAGLEEIVDFVLERVLGEEAKKR
jgi:hypothetical protein